MKIKEWMEDMGITGRDIIEGVVGWGSLLIMVFMASVIFG